MRFYALIIVIDIYESHLNQFSMLISKICSVLRKNLQKIKKRKFLHIKMNFKNENSFYKENNYCLSEIYKKNYINFVDNKFSTRLIYNVCLTMIRFINILKIHQVFYTPQKSSIFLFSFIRKSRFSFMLASKKVLFSRKFFFLQFRL